MTEAVLAPPGEITIRKLEFEIQSLIEAHVAGLAVCFNQLDDRKALGDAYMDAIPETAGSHRTFEDGIRQSWSPTQKEDRPFARFITELEAVFWTVRREILRNHTNVVDSLNSDDFNSWLTLLDSEIRRESLAQIEHANPRI